MKGCLVDNHPGGVGAVEEALMNNMTGNWINREDIPIILVLNIL